MYIVFEVWTDAYRTNGNRFFMVSVENYYIQVWTDAHWTSGNRSLTDPL